MDARRTRAAPADGPPWAPPRPPVADAPGRDYGIDASNVLSMNVDSVETVTGGIQSDTPDFASVVNDPANWEPYAQRTYRACFADSEGYILSRVAGPDPSKQGYYDDVTELPAEGQGTPETYYLIRMARTSNGSFSSYSVKRSIPAGTTTAQLLDKNGSYRLNGSIYSYVKGGSYSNSRDDFGGWWGTALLNNNEYDADNIDASFRLIKGGNLNEGFAFMVTKSDVVDRVTHNGVTYQVPRLSGYFMSVCCHNYNAVRTLWRIDDLELDAGFDANSSNGMWCCPGRRGLENIWYAGNQHSYIPASFTGPTSVQITQKPTQMTALATWIDDAQNIDYNVKADGKSIKITRTDNGAEKDSNGHNTTNNAASLGFPHLQTTEGITFPNERDVEETVADISITENGNGSTSYSDAVSGKGTTIDKPNFRKGTYGFWGQNCEQGNQALITDMSVRISKQIVKSFGNIVEEPAWTTGALHMLINIDSEADSTMLVGADAVRQWFNLELAMIRENEKMSTRFD